MRGPEASEGTIAEFEATAEEATSSVGKDGDSFLVSLQELRSLRPQLQAAAEYCKSTYVHGDGEQKEAVVQNLKEYVIKALVNAVDQLGTVAYQLNNELTKQSSSIEETHVHVAMAAQRLKTCNQYLEHDSLKQQQQLKPTSRCQKQYIVQDKLADLALAVTVAHPEMRRENFDFMNSDLIPSSTAEGAPSPWGRDGGRMSPMSEFVSKQSSALEQQSSKAGGFLSSGDHSNRIEIGDHMEPFAKWTGLQPHAMPFAAERRRRGRLEGDFGPPSDDPTEPWAGGANDGGTLSSSRSVAGGGSNLVGTAASRRDHCWESNDWDRLHGSALGLGDFEKPTSKTKRFLNSILGKKKSGKP